MGGENGTMSDFLERISNLSPKRLALLALELQTKVAALESAAQASPATPEPIAIVGLSCRFPGPANDPDAFWRLLHTGVDAISEIDATRWSVEEYFDPDPDKPGKVATRWGGFLRDIRRFDPQFFGIAPREAMSMDPQQRLALELSWEALENAGYAPDTLSGTATGVFMGICNGDYYQLQLAQQRDSIDMYSATGNAHSVISGRIAYVLGLHGPALSIDTACSSSLVAVHLAAQSLRDGDCQLALAGGVNLVLSPDTTIALSRAKMMAPDGRCKAFDAAADGFVRSEGGGLVVLKRLSAAVADGDNIRAIIRGSALNQDGRSNGLTAPHGPSQVAVIRRALAQAGVTPDQIGYVETHGTGTALGDPIEAQALGAALGQNRSTPLAIGSVKTNIGHAEAAAGVAGLIKVVLSLQHQEIPPHLHLKRPSEHIPWAELPLTIPTVPTPWRPINGRRLAGVSSFGFSGTNAHLIVEEAPHPVETQDRASATPAAAIARPVQLIALSAKTDSALKELAARYEQYLAAQPDLALADLAHTANVGRAHFNHRLAIVANSVDQLRATLAAYGAGQDSNLSAGQARSNRQPEIAFLFTGQGAQYVEMGRALYDTQPVFRATLDRCDELLRPYMGQSVLAALYPDSALRGQPPAIDLMAIAQPALFAIEYALTEVWKSWGIRPSIVAGHSVGEVVAACVAGVFSLADGLKLVAERGRLLQTLPPTGEMAAVFADEARVRLAIAPDCDRVSIAAINWPDSVVISGEKSAVQPAIERLRTAGFRARALKVAIAAHSPFVEPILDPFEAIAATVKYAPPQIDFVSGLTGQLAGREVAKANYWRRHIREAVRFADAIETLRQRGVELFVEIGPAPTLIGMAQRCVPAGVGVWLPSLRPGTADGTQLLTSLGQLYARGVDVDWAGFDRGTLRAGRRIPLPTYPFQRQPYWFNQSGQVDQRAPTAPRPPALDESAHPLLGRRISSPVIKDVVFETQLNAHWPPFLDHHRIYGLVVLPSPAYIEMALAAAAQVLGAASPALEDLLIQTALLLPETGSRVIQLTLAEAHDQRVAFQVFAQNDRPTEWTRHATGVVNLEPIAPADATLAVDEVQGRCPTAISGADYYARLRELGLEFGSDFRGMTQLWRRDGEALGLIDLPENLVTDAPTYHIHPALLDACFHVLGAPLPQTADLSTFLLIGLDRFVLYRAPGTRLWNHTVLRSGPGAIGETFTGDIQLFDEAGRLVAEAQGLHLKRVTRDALRRITHPSPLEDWLYEVQWRAQANQLATSALTPLQIAERLQPQLAALSAEHGLAVYGELLPELDALSVGYISAALRRLGWQPHPGERVTAPALAARLGVIDRHQRLLSRWLSILADEGALRACGADWEVIAPLPVVEIEPRRRHVIGLDPIGRAEVALLDRCGPRLADVLRGEVDPLQLLFPNGSLALTEPLYSAVPSARAYNALVQQAVATALTDQAGPVRVLEIGAGTGATTAGVLSVLPPARTTYTFTDVSPVFLANAAEQFRGYDFMRYQLLDIEREPGAQGFEAQAFEVIIAANVLHATRDLRETLRNMRQLLAPGGRLVLLEGTAPQRWVDITFGLTAGWWRFADTDWRSNYPLLSAAQWLDRLESQGFQAAPALALPVSADAALEQAVIVAGAPIAAAHWLIVGDQGEVGQRLTELLTARGQHARQVQAVDYERWLTGADYQGVVDVTSLAAEGVAATRCDQVLQLTQTLIRTRRSTKLWVVTRGAQSVEAADQPALPDAATLWGLGRVIALEHPEVWGGLIDLSTASAPLDAAAAILTDLLNGDGEDQIAWRADRRYVPRLMRKTWRPAAAAWQASRAGAYLITGGLGGLGLKLAAWLAERGARQLVLLGRRGAGGRDADRTGRAIAAIEAAGVSVTVIAADVADRAQMTAVFDRFGRDLPTLRGVFHAAAALSAWPVADLPTAALRDMLRPKVDGARLLHELTRHLKLDCFVMFSSTTALWGARTLAHYAAANAFLDALADYRRSLNLPALSINWGTWAEMRAAARDDQRAFAQFGLQPMPDDQALAALGELLSRSDSAHAVVAAVDWRTLKSAYEARRPKPFLSQVEDRARASAPPGSARETPAAARAGTPPPELQQRFAQAPAHDRREAVAAFVRAQVAKVLAWEAARPIDDQQGLFEMGMDSLMSVELKSRLEVGVGHPLPSTLTFNYPTVAALTDFLLADLNATTAPPVAPVAAPEPVTATPVDDPADLSEDELADRLAAQLSQLR